MKERSIRFFSQLFHENRLGDPVQPVFQKPFRELLGYSPRTLKGSSERSGAEALRRPERNSRHWSRSYTDFYFAKGSHGRTPALRKQSCLLPFPKLLGKFFKSLDLVSLQKSGLRCAQLGAEALRSARKREKTCTCSLNLIQFRYLREAARSLCDLGYSEMRAAQNKELSSSQKLDNQFFVAY